MTIVNYHGNSFGITASKKDKAEFKRNVKLSRNLTKEAMSMSKVKLVRIMEKSKLEEKRSMPFNDAIRRRPKLKELQVKKYLSPDSDLSSVLDDLIEKGVFNFES